MIDNIIIDKELSQKILNNVIEWLILNPDNLLLIEQINKTENKENLSSYSTKYLMNMYNNYLPYFVRAINSMSNDIQSNNLSEKEKNVFVNDQTLSFQNYIFPFILSDLLNKDFSSEKEKKISALNKKFYDKINYLIDNRQDVIIHEIKVEKKNFFEASHNPELEKKYINKFLKEFMIKEMIDFNSLLRKKDINEEDIHTIEISKKLTSELNEFKKHRLANKKYKSSILQYIANGNSQINTKEGRKKERRKQKN